MVDQEIRLRVVSVRLSRAHYRTLTGVSCEIKKWCIMIPTKFHGAVEGFLFLDNVFAAK
jgi:hypothetical protein